METRLSPHHVSGSRYRYYSQAQVNELLRKKEPVQRIVVGYARVSSPKQKDDLERQIEMFSGRLQGKRVNKAKKMLGELMEDDSSEKSQNQTDS